jgi:hypothetical protein
MATPKILPPPSGPDKPDKETQAGLRDYTAPSADNRVLFVNLGIIRYGTHDKTHAAALVFSVILLIFIACVGFFTLSKDPSGFSEKWFTWLTNTFLFVAGIALGKSGSEKSAGD